MSSESLFCTSAKLAKKLLFPAYCAIPDPQCLACIYITHTFLIFGSFSWYLGIAKCYLKKYTMWAVFKTGVGFLFHDQSRIMAYQIIPVFLGSSSYTHLKDLETDLDLCCCFLELFWTVNTNMQLKTQVHLQPNATEFSQAQEKSLRLEGCYCKQGAMTSIVMFLKSWFLATAWHLRNKLKNRKKSPGCLMLKKVLGWIVRVPTKMT